MGSIHTDSVNGQVDPDRATGLRAAKPDVAERGVGGIKAEEAHAMDYSTTMAVVWRVLALTVVVGCGAALPAASLDPPQNSRNSIAAGDDLMDTIYSDCLNKGSVSCVKYKLFSFVDKVLSSKDTFSLTEGVTVVKTAGAAPVGDGAPRALTQDDARTQDVESMVTSRMEKFLQTHTVKIDLKGSDVLNAVTSAGRALTDAADTLGLNDDGAEETGRKKSKLFRFYFV